MNSQASSPLQKILVDGLMKENNEVSLWIRTNNDRRMCFYCHYPVMEHLQKDGFLVCKPFAHRIQKDGPSRSSNPMIAPWLDALWQQTMGTTQQQTTPPLRTNIPRIIPRPRKFRTLIVHKRLLQQQQYLKPQPVLMQIEHTNLLDTSDLSAVYTLATLHQSSFTFVHKESKMHTKRFTRRQVTTTTNVYKSISSF
jgi:hypothetical protein